MTFHRDYLLAKTFSIVATSRLEDRRSDSVRSSAWEQYVCLKGPTSKQRQSGSPKPMRESTSQHGNPLALELRPENRKFGTGSGLTSWFGRRLSVHAIIS